MILDKIIEKYDLKAKSVDTWVYLKKQKNMNGLKQSDILSNKLLQKWLPPSGYYPYKHTAGLWLHKTRKIEFTLVVDEFLVKYVGTKNAHHLHNALLRSYEITTDWGG